MILESKTANKPAEGSHLALATIRMRKFGYIVKAKNIVIDVFRIGSQRAIEFERIMNLDLSEYSSNEFLKIMICDELNQNIENRIKYYLSIRNNDNPDYGIDWKGRFSRTDIFNKTPVLGIEMELFSGNEDYVIAFLANIHNQIKDRDTELNWFLVDNHYESEKMRSKL